MEQSLKKQQELLEEAAGKKEYTQQLGQFLTKMDQAGPLLVTMLSSRSIVDTVEVIRVFSFLHGYGFDFRLVNRILVRVVYYIRRVEDLKTDAVGSVYFSGFDGARGFNLCENTKFASTVLASHGGSPGPAGTRGAKAE